MDLRHPLPRQISIHRQTVGFCAVGPGFYVWDVDPRAVRETLVDLGWRPDTDVSSPLAAPGRPAIDRERPRP
jgi:hypothetical protein